MGHIKLAAPVSHIWFLKGISELRGTPPKSEKRQLLARRGRVEGGAALLREKSSEFRGKGFVEFAKLPFWVDLGW